MNRISFLNRGYAFKGLLAVYIPIFAHSILLKPVLSLNFLMKMITKQPRSPKSSHNKMRKLAKELRGKRLCATRFPAEHHEQK